MIHHPSLARGISAALVTLVLLPWTAAGAVAQDGPVQVPEGPHTLAVAPDGSSRMRVPVVLRPGTTVADVEIVVADVGSKDGRSLQASEALDVDLVDGGATHTAALVLSGTANAELSRPGSYVVGLLVVRKAKNGKSASAPQRVALTVTRPAPKLAAVGSVVIGHTTRLFSRGGTVPGVLRLAEDSGIAPIRELTFAEVRDPPPAALPASAALVITPMGNGEPHVAPGRLLTAHVGIEGAFDLGQTKGRIEIRSPDLDSVVTVPYEVRARRSPEWIVVIAAFGAFCGWAVRAVLRPRRDLARAQAELSALLSTLYVARDRIADKPFLEGMATLLDRLRLVLEDGDASKLLEAATQVRTDLGKLESNLAERRTRLLDAFKPLDEALHRAYRLPRDVTERLHEARHSMAEIVELIDGHNVAAGQERLDAVGRGEVQRTLEAASAWHDAIDRYLAAVTQAPPPASNQTQSRWREGLAVERPASAGEPPAAATASDVVKVLDALHLRHREVAERLDGLRQESFDFTSRTRAQLGAEVGGPIEEASEQLWAPVAAEIESPAKANLAWEERARATRRSWLDALAAGPGQVKRAELDVMLERGLWTEAVEMATTPIDISAGRRPRPTAIETETSTSDLHPARDEERGPVGPAPSSSVGRVTLPLSGSSHERLKLFKAARTAERWQSAIVALLFVLGVFGLYLDTWVGTPKEMVGLLLLAFGIDLTADNVLAALKKSGNG